MRFSYNWLKDYIKGRILKPEKLAETLTLHSFEVENVVKKAGDFVLDIDVLPNRASDCLSHIGIARECAALLNSKLQIPNYKLKQGKKSRISNFLRVEIKDKKLCPRYTARVIADVKVKDSPKWIKDRLLACGIKPINNIVDVTNCIMLEIGQPIHAFDFDKVSGIQNKKAKIKNKKHISKIKKFIIRKAKQDEKINTLDGGEYKLDRDVLVIADKRGPLAIAGIKGGKKAEIDKDTQTIVLESANFDPLIIRRASKKLGIRTDASRRFEAGLDPNLCGWGLDRAASIIQKVSRGEVVKGIVDKYPEKTKPIKIKLELGRVKDLLGIEIPQTKIVNILKRLGLGIKNQKFSLKVEVPTWRRDLNIPQDLIEEIARIYGYNKICSQMPKVQLSIPKRNTGLLWEEKIKDILAGGEFTEVYNYSFVNNADKRLILNADKTLIEIKNPMNINQRYLRTSLIPNLLSNVNKNLKHFNKLKIFELGNIYWQEKQEIQEKQSLAGAVVSARTGFYQAKGAVELLLNKLGIQNINLQPRTLNPESQTLNPEPSLWHPGRSAEIKAGRKTIGTIGEIHPNTLAKYDIDSRVAVFELDPEILFESASPHKTYKPISRYPSITLDLAVIVNKRFGWGNIKDRVFQEGKRLVKKVKLFDVYKGKGIPRGKVSFAFHVIYQAKDRTLKEKEAKPVHEKIIKVLEKMGGEVRR